MPALPALLFRLAQLDLKPILAHPERCTEFHRDGSAEEAVRLGATLQLDIGALTGRYGRDAKHFAERFLEAGLYGVAATDCHSPVKAEAWVAAALTTLEKRAGKAQLDQLCSENPRRVVAGEELV